MGIKLFLLVSGVQCPAKCSVLPTFGYFKVANAQLSKLKVIFFFDLFFSVGLFSFGLNCSLEAKAFPNTLGFTNAKAKKRSGGFT